MPKRYTVTDKTTKRSYTFDWAGDEPPTELDVQNFLDQKFLEHARTSKYKPTTWESIKEDAGNVVEGFRRQISGLPGLQFEQTRRGVAEWRGMPYKGGPVLPGIIGGWKAAELPPRDFTGVPSWRQKVAGATDIASGLLGMTTPALPFAGGVARTVGALALGTGASIGTEKGAEWLGASPEVAEAAGLGAGIYAGSRMFKAPKATTPTTSEVAPRLVGPGAETPQARRITPPPRPTSRPQGPVEAEWTDLTPRIPPPTPRQIPGAAAPTTPPPGVVAPTTPPINYTAPPPPPSPLGPGPRPPLQLSPIQAPAMTTGGAFEMPSAAIPMPPVGTAAAFPNTPRALPPPVPNRGLMLQAPTGPPTPIPPTQIPAVPPPVAPPPTPVAPPPVPVAPPVRTLKGVMPKEPTVIPSVSSVTPVQPEVAAPAQGATTIPQTVAPPPTIRRGLKRSTAEQTPPPVAAPVVNPPAPAPTTVTPPVAPPVAAPPVAPVEAPKRVLGGRRYERPEPPKPPEVKPPISEEEAYKAAVEKRRQAQPVETPKPTSTPEPTPEVKLMMAEHKEGDFFIGKSGGYEVKKVEPNMVTYEFTNKKGESRTSSMPIVEFTKLRRASEALQEAKDTPTTSPSKQASRVEKAEQELLAVEPPEGPKSSIGKAIVAEKKGPVQPPTVQTTGDNAVSKRIAELEARSIKQRDEGNLRGMEETEREIKMLRKSLKSYAPKAYDKVFKKGDKLFDMKVGDSAKDPATGQVYQVAAREPLPDGTVRIKFEPKKRGLREEKKGERGSVSISAEDVEAIKAALGRGVKTAREFFSIIRPTISRIREQGGEYGEHLANLIEKARDYGDVMAGKLLIKLHEVDHTKLSSAERFRVLDALEGRLSPTALNATESSIHKVYKDVLDKIGDVALKRQLKVRLSSGEKVPFAKKQNYFPHIIPSISALRSGATRTRVIENLVRQRIVRNAVDANKFIDHYIDFVESGRKHNSLLQYMVKTKQAKTPADALDKLLKYRKEAVKRQGSLEYAREVDLPFYDPDPTYVIPQYIGSSSRRLMQTRFFGQENEVIKEAIYKIDRAGGDAEFTNKAVDRILAHINEGDTAMEKFSRFTRTMQGFKLGLAAIPNAAQGFLGSALKGDLLSAIEGTAKAYTKAGKKFGIESGANIDSIIHEATSHAGASGKLLGKYLEATGFSFTEKMNRTIAANSGRIYVQKLAKMGESAKPYLKELGLDADAVIARGGKLTANEILLAAKKFSDITQFRIGPQDVPYFASSAGGKILFQFKSFVYGQSRLIYNSTVKEFTSGHLGRGSRNIFVLLSLFPAAGEVVNDLKSMLTGKKRESDPLKRYIENALATGVGGVLLDAFEAGSFGKGTEFLTGPTISDFGGLIEGGANAAKGNVTPLFKFLYRHVPLVGPITSRRVFPQREGSARVGPPRMPSMPSVRAPI